MVKTIVVLEDGKVTHSIDENDWEGIELKEGKLVAKIAGSKPDSPEFEPRHVEYSSEPETGAGTGPFNLPVNEVRMAEGEVAQSYGKVAQTGREGASVARVVPWADRKDAGVAGRAAWTDGEKASATGGAVWTDGEKASTAGGAVWQSREDAGVADGALTDAEEAWVDKTEAHASGDPAQAAFYQTGNIDIQEPQGHISADTPLERNRNTAWNGQSWRSRPVSGRPAEGWQRQYGERQEDMHPQADVWSDAGLHDGNQNSPYTSTIHSRQSSPYTSPVYSRQNSHNAEAHPAFQGADADSDSVYIRKKAENKSKETKGFRKQIKKILSVFLIVMLSAAAGFGGGYISSSTGNREQVLIGGATQSINITPSEQISTTEVVAAKVIPSVVGITSKGTRKFDTYFFGSYSREEVGVGTGIVVDEIGYILTNSHVVMDGVIDSITVLLPDSREIEGKVLWQDRGLDLAIVKVEADNLVAAELGDSDKIKIGSYAAAIGNPMGLEFRSSVSQGVISGLDRTITTGSDFGEAIQMEGLLQVDAAINNGNSGGPLVNSKGEVIGINTAKNQSGEGMGFAIPINVAMPIVKSVKETGEFHRVYIGISPRNVTDLKQAYPHVDLGVDSGALVVSVTPGSPAERAGVRENDIITGLNGKEVKSSGDLIKQLLGYKSGDKVQLTIVRDKNTLEMDIILTDKLA